MPNETKTADPTQTSKSVNQTVVAYGAGCWGKADNVPDAMTNCKRAGSLKRGDKVHLTLYATSKENISVMDWGCVEYPNDTARFDLGIVTI